MISPHLLESVLHVKTFPGIDLFAGFSEVIKNLLFCLLCERVCRFISIEETLCIFQYKDPCLFRHDFKHRYC